MHHIGEVVKQTGIAGERTTLDIQTRQVVTELLLRLPTMIDLLLPLFGEPLPLGLQKYIGKPTFPLQLVDQVGYSHHQLATGHQLLQRGDLGLFRRQKKFDGGVGGCRHGQGPRSEA